MWMVHGRARPIRGEDRLDNRAWGEEAVAAGSAADLPAAAVAGGWQGEAHAGS